MLFEPVTFEPIHPELRKYIRYYYFLRTESEEFSSRYYAYPHTDTVLNIHRHAAFHIDGYYTKVKGGLGYPASACVQGIREYPLLAHLTGRLDKVTILFKPLGINQFINTPFGLKYNQPSMVFNEWDQDARYEMFLQEFFDTDSFESRAAMLENFLLSVMQPLGAYDILSAALAQLNHMDYECSVDDLCNQLQILPRTFNRLFRKHFGVSPLTYRKVARFRHSLDNKLLTDDLKRMTDLAYQSNYYDQSHFNKIFRNLTGTNPKLFFKHVERLANDRLLFNFTNDELV